MESGLGSWPEHPPGSNMPQLEYATALGAMLR